MEAAESTAYPYPDAHHARAHEYLLPAVRSELAAFFERSVDRRVFDLGCGNGSVAASLTTEGFVVTGVDSSTDGISRANEAYPSLQLKLGSAYDDLAGRFGEFPAVISLEVVEHVYAPRAFARTLFSLVEPGGIALVSTPYHGYVKNLALALSGRMDQHFTALLEHGHIKFWSVRTLTELLEGAGFHVARIRKLGRLPPLAKSMLLVAIRPEDGARPQISTVSR